MKASFTLILCYAMSVYLSAQDSTGRSNEKQIPSWVREGVIYQLFLGSFTPEGTLRAAAKQLPTVAELGVTILYLPPVMVMDTSMDKQYWATRQKLTSNPKNPYRIMDYTKVDPEYGTGEDLKEFIRIAHNFGMKVIIDLVYLHSGPSHPFIKQHPEFYLRDSVGKILINQWSFPRFDFKNSTLREYLLVNMENWVRSFNLDGFRCDVAGGIPVDFWEEARERIEKINPTIGMLAECDDNSKLMQKAFDVSYGWKWYYCLMDVCALGKPATLLSETWEKQNKIYPSGARRIRFSDNLGRNRTDMVFSYGGSKAVNVINFMIDGVPFLYNGQEIGDGTPMGVYSHWPVIWDAKGGDLNQTTELRNWYKKLIELRKNEAVLKNGNTLWLETDNPGSVVAFLRRNSTDEIITVVNLSNRPLSEIKVSLPGKNGVEYVAIFSDNDKEAFKTSTDFLMVTLNGYGYFAGKLKN